MEKLDRSKILAILHDIDDQLTEPTGLVLGGQTAMILQGMDFRSTFDIDLVTIPSKQFMFISLKYYRDVFNYQTAGVIQLLDDYEDRLVILNEEFKCIQVELLSLKDWAASKLISPKLDDLLNNDAVNLEI